MVYQMEKKLYDENIIYFADGFNTSMPEEAQTYAKKSLIQLKAALLKLAAAPQLTQYVMYMFPVTLHGK